MSNDSMTYKKHHHALVIPMPSPGHIIPATHLAIQLASKGLTITFLNTEVNNNKTISDIFTQAKTSGLKIHYKTVSDGLPIDLDRALNRNEFFASLIHNVPREVENLIQNSVSSDSPFTCLIMDALWVWSAEMATKFQLPYVALWTSSGHDFSDQYKAAGRLEAEADTDEAIKSYLRDNKHKFREPDYILCNTAEELEPKTIQAPQIVNKFYSIGPLIPEGLAKSKVPSESNGTDHQWLDSKPAGSVLYISFGTYAHISKKELEEIAYGVMESGTNFIWVLRPGIIGSNDPNQLPDGFLEATEGRGIVKAWCSQTEVLNHGSIGGFLTHCGWNSVMESVRSEVPMLCYPLTADQFKNRQRVVQDWSIGIDLGGSNTSVCREDVAEKITRLMSADEGRGIKMQIKEISKALDAAIAPGGSSVKNLNKFIEDLTNRH